jgi:gluconolactonase
VASVSTQLSWRQDAIPRRPLTDVRVEAEGLLFPEGPVALNNGTVLVTEIGRGTITAVHPDGAVVVIADCGGGPNGAAIGPDENLYVCNNGGPWAPGTWRGGWLDRIYLLTGAVARIYEACAGHRLSGPNDIVFDTAGNFWFTDIGKTKGRQRDLGSVYYATPDGGHLEEVIHPADSPNGIGLAADGRTLYYAETSTACLRRRTITSPGTLATSSERDPSTLVCGLPGYHGFDSLALDVNGDVGIGTLWRLLSCLWDIPGLPLAYPEPN